MHIELPEALTEQIGEVYEDEGYNSRSEFVREATRRQLRELQTQ